MNSTFCPIPWIFQAVRANGDIRVCCQANITQNKGVLRKKDGTAFNAQNDSLAESRNSDLIKSMRVNMLNGIWSDECARCKSEEESNLNSRRQYESQQWNFDINDARAVTSEDGFIDITKSPVIYYDLRFGNFCNLKCRMCGPTDSSAWYDDWVTLYGTKFKDTSGTIEIKQDSKGKYFTTEFDWHQSETFWNQLESNADKIQHVYMAGGEPLIIERHYEFLEKCVSLSLAKNIIIEYNTNMSSIPNRAINLWKNFKQVRIGASIDGSGEFLEYQRYPAKWDKVHKNLQLIDNLPSNIVCWLAFTVTAYNVFHMPDFMSWKLFESGFKKINSSKHRPIVTHHVAHHPKHLNVRVLPNEVKHQASAKFIKFIENINASSLEKHVKDNAAKICQSVMYYMNSDSYYDKEWNNFKKYTLELDQLRSQSVIDLVPSLKGFIDAV